MIKLHPPLLSRLPLALSLLLNAALVTCWAYRFVSSPVPVEPARAPSVTPTPSAPSSPPVATTAFSWSQIESDDYPTYIRNLRRIGCPEETIRDLIEADVAARGSNPVQGLPARQVSTSTPGNPSKSRRENLRPEQAGLVASLLAEAAPGVLPRNTSSPASTGAADGGAALSGGSRASVGSSPVSTGGGPGGGTAPLIVSGGAFSGGVAGGGGEPVVMPAALVNQPAAAPMNEAQQQALAKLQQKFVDAVGGPNQDPSDPNYLARWQDAQWMADMQFRALYGAGAFAERQKQAAVEAMQKQPQTK